MVWHEFIHDPYEYVYKKQINILTSILSPLVREGKQTCRQALSDLNNLSIFDAMTNDAETSVTK